METIGIYEAKTHLPRLLDRVAKGEKITITPHGVPVAVLQPPESHPQWPIEEYIQEMKNFRTIRDKSHPSNLSIKELIEEGRD